MVRHRKQHLDIYSELCPASSATVLGAGLVTITMGSIEAGVALIIAGIGVGVLGPIAKSLEEHGFIKRH